MQRSSYLPSMDRRTERTQLPLHLRDVYALVTWRTGAIALLISNLIFIMMLEQSTGQNDAVGRVTNGLSTPLSTAAATATSSAAASASPSASALLPSPVTMVVADQAAGAFRRCAANPFIKNWAASDFARAREKLATWAVSSFTVMQPTSQWDLEVRRCDVPLAFLGTCDRNSFSVTRVVWRAYAAHRCLSHRRLTSTLEGSSLRPS